MPLGHVCLVHHIDADAIAVAVTVIDSLRYRKIVTAAHGTNIEIVSRLLSLCVATLKET